LLNPRHGFWSEAAEGLGWEGEFFLARSKRLRAPHWSNFCHSRGAQASICSQAFLINACGHCGSAESGHNARIPLPDTRQVAAAIHFIRRTHRARFGTWIWVGNFAAGVSISGGRVQGERSRLASFIPLALITPARPCSSPRALPSFGMLPTRDGKRGAEPRVRRWATYPAPWPIRPTPMIPTFHTRVPIR